MIRHLSAADVVTLTNAILGFLALLMVFSNQLQLAALFIFLGLLADGLDGFIARHVGNGQMGEYLEAIADMISLSIAPLALFYMTYHDAVVSQPYLYLLIIGVLVFSCICSVVRLSSFSLFKEKESFIGLPTSASAIVVVLISFFKPTLWYALPVIILLSLLMISSIRFPKPGLKGDLITAVFIIATISLNNMYYSIAPLLLFAAITSYIIFGPIYFVLKKRNRSTETKGNRN